MRRPEILIYEKENSSLGKQTKELFNLINNQQFYEQENKENKGRTWDKRQGKW